MVLELPKKYSLMEASRIAWRYKDSRSIQPPDFSSLMISMGDFCVEKRFVRSDVMRSEDMTRMRFTIQHD